jgi:hypothetical protein
MGQFMFFCLVIIALLAGAFAYYAPKQKPIDPMQFMMESSGLNTVETVNHTKTQSINLSTNMGLMEIRGQMDELQQKQNNFLDAIKDEQQVLQDTGKDANGIMLQAQGSSDKNSADVLRLKELTDQIQDQQRLLVSHGQDLIALNDQLTQSRQMVAEQMALANTNVESSLTALQQRYSMLQNQANGYFDRVNQHNQEVRDQIEQMNNHLQEMAQSVADNSADQQDSLKTRIRALISREHQGMAKLADSEEKSRDLLQNSQEKVADSIEKSQESQQRSQDLMDQEREKAQDQKEMLQQRVDDQMQRIQDQRDR